MPLDPFKISACRPREDGELAPAARMMTAAARSRAGVGPREHKKMTTDQNTSTAPVDFIRAIVAADVASGKHGGRVATRFPPEPNGYLHIGHAKSICLNFGIALERRGTCNLRFDDTNPTKEDIEYVEAIEDDVRWLGFSWDSLYFASDYFEKLYGFAVDLIRRDKAYVDSLKAEEIR